MKHVSVCFAACVLVLTLMPAELIFAQISAGGTPPSFSTNLREVVPTSKMVAVDAEAYLAEDTQAPKDTPYRIAAELDVSLNLKNSGVWSALSDGRLWRLRIESTGAYSIALAYDSWFIPEGGKLWIYNDRHSQVIGAFTNFNNWKEGTNITSHVAGDAVTLEYFEPYSVYDESVLSIFRVVHAYRNVFGVGSSLDDFLGSGSCNNNINCPEGANWQTNKRGVALIIESGSRICTGSLINNTSQNLVPYFLTANHCWSSSATGWVFVFNYESATCANPASEPSLSQTIANATNIAKWSTSDFCLMQLSSYVPTAYNPYFNGWNRVDAAATNSVCIHHPDCDIKKISFDNNAPVSSGYFGSGSSHWNILAWEDGTTEPGSSGSPLFDQNHRITGQLHGGDAQCSNNVNDFFGKFATSWAGGGSSTNRLSNWLDPGSTGATTLDGLDGSTAASITVGVPNGGETWLLGDAYNITWTSANVSGNIKIELNRTYPSVSWETLFASIANDGNESWTVSGTLSSNCRIRITSVTAPTVGDTSNVSFTLATRTVLVTAPNGGETWLLGDANNITWTPTNMTENVKIELNRSYPSVSWEILFASTSNDGAEPWTASGNLSSTCRIRITGVTHTAVSDTSNGNFTIANRTLTVTLPNGGETWLLTDVDSIKWTFTNLSENVRIELNRSYPSVNWETLVGSTANDGTEPWTVTGTLSSTARVRITGVTHGAVSDTSDGNFAIANRTITVTVPNGGESWRIGDSDTVRWTSSNLAENVKIELNRSYPSASWVVLTASTSNTGSYPWIVTSPTASTVRVRITGVTHTTIGDSSNANFSIVPGNQPPVITHDPLDDQDVAVFPVTALVTDDAVGFVTRFFYRPSGLGAYDSLLMPTSGYANEYAGSVGPLAEGRYDYYLLARDAGGLTASTQVYRFDVGAGCGVETAYDDGTAERSNYSTQIGYRWAVKFSVPGTPYVLCRARVGISDQHPSTAHTSIKVQVLLADGAGNLPGTVVYTDTTGSIGDVIGGVPSSPDNWATIVFRNILGDPLQVNGDFYIAVGNPVAANYEAFLEDTSSSANHSFVFDPCDSLWFPESAADSSCRRGNRMIRATGFGLIPPVVVIARNAADIKLNWTNVSAPLYNVYSASSSVGPFSTLEGSVTDTFFVDSGAAADSIRFYIVRSALP